MPLQPEGLHIELVDVDAVHRGRVRVKIPVVVNTRALTLDPLAIGPQVGSRRAAFDLVAERVLAPVRFWKNAGVVETEQAGAQQETGDHHGAGQAVQAYAGGLESDHLVVFGHDAESDQDRH